MECRYPKEIWRNIKVHIVCSKKNFQNKKCVKSENFPCWYAKKCVGLFANKQLSSLVKNKGDLKKILPSREMRFWCSKRVNHHFTNEKYLMQNCTSYHKDYMGRRLSKIHLHESSVKLHALLYISIWFSLWWENAKLLDSRKKYDLAGKKIKSINYKKISWHISLW